MKFEASKSRETKQQSESWSAAEALLAAARERDAAAVEAAVCRLEGAIVAYVGEQQRGGLGKLAADIGIGTPELAHWAVAQLRRKPPMGTPGRAAEVTLRAWCKTTVRNRLLSLWRELSDEPRRVKSKTEVEPTAKPTRTKRPELEHLVDPTAEADGTTLRAERAVAIAEMLQTCFPRGLELAEMRVNAPEASDKELAVALGIGYANLHKRRSRTRVYVAVFELLQEDEGLDDQGLVDAIGASVSKEMLAVVAKVRDYVSGV